jgi:hypothetical protein
MQDTLSILQHLQSRWDLDLKITENTWWVEIINYEMCRKNRALKCLKKFTIQNHRMLKLLETNNTESL